MMFVHASHILASVRHDSLDHHKTKAIFNISQLCSLPCFPHDNFSVWVLLRVSLVTSELLT